MSLLHSIRKMHVYHRFVTPLVHAMHNRMNFLTLTNLLGLVPSRLLFARFPAPIERVPFLLWFQAVCGS